VCSTVTITTSLQTAILIYVTAVSGGVNADVLSDGFAVDNVWGHTNALYVAGSGDNPWALPQIQKQQAKPQGPAYQVNPHYVTPEDIQSDSLPVVDRYPRKRAPASTETPAGNYRGGQAFAPYGMNYVPGYSVPGYGGYYGDLPGMDMGLPGYGADPMLIPYGNGMDMGYPYNLMMQPNSAGSVRESD
jgi:hypothetical protein